MPARCLAVGVLVFAYWTAAFSSAVADKLLTFKHGSIERSWWNPPWLTGPGYRVGRPILGMLEAIPGWNRGAAIGWPFYGVVLLVGAASMSTGAWLLCALLAGRGRQRPTLSGAPPESGNRPLNGWKSPTKWVISTHVIDASY